MFENFQTKPSVVIVYTGEGKGKTSAALGLVMRGLGTGWKVAFVQFIKDWDVGEHAFLKEIKSLYGDRLELFKGGGGFFAAGALSAKGVDETEHRRLARTTLKRAEAYVSSGEFDLVVCDEINNAVADGLLTVKELARLLDRRHGTTSLCLTGRHFPEELLGRADIATEMKKLRHHYDDGYLANKGIDY